MKTLSSPNVVAAHTKVYSKINRDDRVAVLTARNPMKEGTQDIDLHAGGSVCFNGHTNSVEILNGLKDTIVKLFGNDPNALMTMPIFTIRTYFSLEDVGPRAARRPL